MAVTDKIDKFLGEKKHTFVGRKIPRKQMINAILKNTTLYDYSTLDGLSDKELQDRYNKYVD